MQAQAVYITFPSIEEAKEVIAVLLAERLVACANLVSGHSMYTWQGKTESEDEVIAIAKTIEVHLEAIRTRVKTLHSYDVPCITNWPIDAESSYLEWIFENVT